MSTIYCVISHITSFRFDMCAFDGASKMFRRLGKSYPCTFLELHAFMGQSMLYPSSLMMCLN